MAVCPPLRALKGLASQFGGKRTTISIEKELNKYKYSLKGYLSLVVATYYNAHNYEYASDV